MGKCKYRKKCKEYQNGSPLCDEDGGTWYYGKKANCFIKFYNKRK
jgi:hypothetical protein